MMGPPQAIIYTKKSCDRVLGFGETKIARQKIYFL